MKITDMTKRVIKNCIDLSMFVIFLLLMEYHLLPGNLHEWLGLTLFVLFIAHNALNYKWYAVLFKGKYTGIRVIQTAINILLLVAMMICMISSVMISGSVFAWINIGGAMTGRTVHLMTTAWVFVLMSIHLGLHWSVFLGMVKRMKASPTVGMIVRWFLRIVVLGIAVYGMVVFVQRHFYEELFLLTEFKLFDYDTPPFLYLLQTLCVSVLFVSVTYYMRKVSVLIKKSRKAKEVKK